MLSQLPPLPDAAIGVKRRLPLLLAIDITCGAGIHSLRRVESDRRQLRKYWITHRHTTGMVTLPVFHLQDLLSNKGAGLQSMSGQLAVDNDTL